MTQTSRDTSFRQRLFARFMASSDEESFEMYREKKTRLLSSLRGIVVEIGPGTGVNLQFFHPSVQWVGLEPNPAMHAHLHEKAGELGIAVNTRSCTLDESDLAPGSVDAVISTLVLCSVPSVPAILAQVLDVLKPGGTFAFIEHVVDQPWTFRRCVQKVAPFSPWRYLSDGCNPGRDIAGAIRAAGFAHVELDAFMQDGRGLVAKVVRPHIWGTAIKGLG